MAGLHNFLSLEFMLARYNPDGSLDTSCDGDGIFTLDIGGDIQMDTAYGVVFQSVDKIVAVGFSQPTTDSDFALVRFDGDCTPTSVELASFAARGRDRSVELAWKTASELDNLGFHLYRSTSEEGPYQRITSSAIPGLGSSPVGAEYSYRDTNLTNGVAYYYKLEDIETTGKTTFHGPVVATPRLEPTGVGDARPPGTSGVSPARITYGSPEKNTLQVRKQGRRQVVLELYTEGFHAEPQEDGTVRLTIPGFEPVSEAGAPTIPVKRPWVEALAGRKVVISSVQAHGVVSIEGWRPSNTPIPEIEATARGTVTATHRRASGGRASRAPGLEPPEQAHDQMTRQPQTLTGTVPSEGRQLQERFLHITLEAHAQQPGKLLGCTSSAREKGPIPMPVRRCSSSS